MPSKNQSGCRCCECPWTFHVQGSCANEASVGATVTLSQSGTAVAGDTTDSSGNVTFANVPTGTYDVEVVPPSGHGYATYTATGVAHACNQSTTVTLALDSDHICDTCFLCNTPIPKVFSFTPGSSPGRPTQANCGGTYTYDPASGRWYNNVGITIGSCTYDYELTCAAGVGVGITAVPRPGGGPFCSGDVVYRGFVTSPTCVPYSAQIHPSPLVGTSGPGTLMG